MWFAPHGFQSLAHLAKHIHKKSRNIFKSKKKKKIQQPHSGEFLNPHSFSNSDRTECQFCTLEKCDISNKATQKYSCALAQRKYNSFPNEQPVSKCYLVSSCPCWQYFFHLQTQFHKQALICQKKSLDLSATWIYFILCLKVTVYSFFPLYQRRMLKVNSSLQTQ